MLRNAHIWGWLFVLVGPAFLVLASRPSISVWAALVDAAFGFVLLGRGLVCVLRRDELSLDLEPRTYRRRYGTLFARRTIRGSFDELDVLLTPRIFLGARQEDEPDLAGRVSPVDQGGLCAMPWRLSH